MACNRGKYNYIHYNQITGKPDLVVEAAKYTQKLSSFDHGGDYCCNEQCPGVSTAAECCVTVASKIVTLCHSTAAVLSMYMHVPVVLPVIQWDIPKAVALNGSPITGSCSATGYPRPNVRVIIPTGCDYQQNNIHIGNHTNKAVFTMECHKRLQWTNILFDKKQNIQSLEKK